MAHVDVAVARVTPTACGETMARADLDGCRDNLAQALDRNHDVLADLAATLRGHGQRHAVPPAPELGDLATLGRSMDRERPMSERLGQLLRTGRRLLRATVRLGDEHELGLVGLGGPAGLQCRRQSL